MAKEPTKEEAAADEAAAQAAAKEAEEAGVGDDFDKERALKTIRAQRESEKALKAELAEAKAAQEELAKIKQAQEEADKTATDKLADRDARIAQLENQISEAAVKADFMREATSDDRAYLDAELAFLAAEKAGLLGDYDPKKGTVGAHNFDKLEELYPALAGEGSGQSRTGDAGVRGERGKTGTVNSAFNSRVRESIGRR